VPLEQRQSGDCAAAVRGTLLLHATGTLHCGGQRPLPLHTHTHSRARARMHRMFLMANGDHSCEPTDGVTQTGSRTVGWTD
jgi:hypothetical protein